LHLLGFDHAEKKEEAAMFKLQDEILENWRGSK
jgi:ssRNA-specific RNase YbeY (16S rRNA maturation enzyme)